MEIKKPEDKISEMISILKSLAKKVEYDKNNPIKSNQVGVF